MRITFCIIHFFLCHLCFAQQDTTYYYLGEQEQKAKNHVKAIKYFTKAIKYSQKNTAVRKWSYFHRGISKSSIGNCDGAIKDLKKTIDIRVKSSHLYWMRDNHHFRKRINSLAYYSLGDCYYLLGQKDLACQCYSNSKQLGTDVANERIINRCYSKKRKTSNRVYVCSGEYSEKYHSRSNCRGLNNCKAEIYYIESQRAALNSGYVSCDICWR